MQELSSLFMTHHLNVMHAPIKFQEYIPYGFGTYGLDTVYYMELNQGQTIQKPNLQELSCLFMTHRLNVMHAPVKFHEYSPYGLRVMACTQFTIWNQVKGNNSKTKMQELSSLFMTQCLNVLQALVKVHEYIPYGLGVMARTPFII